jgi:hypothetical protein
VEAQLELALQCSSNSQSSGSLDPLLMLSPGPEVMFILVSEPPDESCQLWSLSGGHAFRLCVGDD